MANLRGAGASRLHRDWTGTLYQALRVPVRKQFDVTLIPYYAWANRGPTDMTVWMPVTY